MLILLCLRNACGIDILSSAETALTSHADHSHTHKAGHRTGVVSGGGLHCIGGRITGPIPIP